MTDEELVQTLIGEVLTQYEADSILKSIGNLKSENDELKSRLTHANEECLKWHERAQNLLKDSGGSISGYEKKISDLQAENASMRERLEKAVELPFHPDDCHMEIGISKIIESPCDQSCRISIPIYVYVKCDSLEAAVSLFAELKGGEK